jgi:glycosyltransferase involved in cell wall biosynthesis
MTERSQSDTELQSRDAGYAIGLVATSNNSSDIAGTILRARQHDLTVLVAAVAPSDAESVRFARQLDATVLNTAVEARAIDASRKVLMTGARENGFNGLVFAGTADTPVDFDRSLAAIENEATYTVEAVEQRSGEPGDVVVGIPAYNEAETIGDVVSGALSVADSVLVVDDGSTDETAKLARDAGADVVSHTTNRGYGAALKTLFSTANDWDVSELVIMDADGQHDPADISRLLDRRAETASNIVIGSRFIDGANDRIPLLRRTGIKLINTLTNVLMYSSSGDWMTDAQSGFRVYDKEAIAALASSHRIGNGMSSSIDILLIATRTGLDITEVGIAIDYTVPEPNTHNPLLHGLALVQNIIRAIETEYPVRMLGAPGLVVLLIGLGFGYWTAINYIDTRTFPIGLAIAATFFALAGTFTVFTAIVLHSLREHYRSISGAIE